MEFREFKRLPRWFKEGYRANPVVFFVFTFATCIQGPLLAIAVLWSGKLVDQVPGFIEGNVTNVQVLLTSLVILGIGLLVTSGVFVQMIAKGRLQDSIAYKIKRQLLQASLETDYLAFLKSEKQNRLDRILRGFDMDLTLLLMDSVSCLGTTWTIVSYLGIIGFTSSWYVAIAGLLFFVPITFINLKLVQKEFKFDQKVSSDDRRIKYTEYVLTGSNTAKEIKLFGLGGYLSRIWEARYRKLKSGRSRIEIHQHIWKASTQIMALAISAGLLFLVLGRGGVSPGEFLVILTALTFIQSGLVEISKTTATLVLRLERLEEIDTYLREKDPLEYYQINEQKVLPVNSNHTRPAIVIENVSFSYDTGKNWALKNIDLTINPGKKIALVGMNGAGKSTIIHLLLGLYRPLTGRILINGYQPYGMDSKTRHKMISAVFQQFGRYHGLTLWENISLSSFDPAFSPGDLLVGGSELFPTLEDKMGLVVGKEFDGTELSGGEWQRIALARAMMLNTPIVILDEPTAALDPLGEAGLFKEFMGLLHKKTVIVVTHRLGSIKEADEIIVLKDGQVEEIGNHDELINRQGHYWQMFEAQAEWYREPAAEIHSTSLQESNQN